MEVVFVFSENFYSISISLTCCYSDRCSILLPLKFMDYINLIPSEHSQPLDVYLIYVWEKNQSWAKTDMETIILNFNNLWLNLDTMAGWFPSMLECNKDEVRRADREKERVGEIRNRGETHKHSLRNRKSIKTGVGPKMQADWYDDCLPTNTNLKHERILQWVRKDSKPWQLTFYFFPIKK